MEACGPAIQSHRWIRGVVLGWEAGLRLQRRRELPGRDQARNASPYHGNLRECERVSALGIGACGDRQVCTNAHVPETAFGARDPGTAGHCGVAERRQHQAVCGCEDGFPLP
eukprot:635352-Rhodomonas_salina.2